LDIIINSQEMYILTVALAIVLCSTMLSAKHTALFVYLLC